jgi:hypothetical protein
VIKAHFLEKLDATPRSNEIAVFEFPAFLFRTFLFIGELTGHLGCDSPPKECMWIIKTGSSASALPSAEVHSQIQLKWETTGKERRIA